MGLFSHIPLEIDTSDTKAQNTAFAITRESSATYIDKNGVMQTADGDSSGGVDVVDNEDGATSITGDFEDATAILEDDAGIITAQAATGYLVKVEDDGGLFAYAYLGASSGNGAIVYKEPDLLTRGWAIVEATFNTAALTAFDVYSNIPTATGAGAEVGIESDGIQVEGGASTNIALQARDLTSATWSKTDCTALKDVTGQDGVANSASRLTATGANATCLQTMPTGLPSATHIYSVRMKRITGTGAISMTDDDSNYTEKTLTTSWQRFSVTRSQTTATIGIKMADSGDVIAVDFNQFELSQAYATSDIPTTTIPMARTAGTYTWEMSDDFKDLMGDTANSPFTMIVEWTPKFSYGDVGAVPYPVVSIKTGVYDNILSIDSDGTLSSDDGPSYSHVDPNYASGTTYLYALRVYYCTEHSAWEFEAGESHDAGVTWTWDASPADYDGSFNPSTYLQLGYGNIYPFNIKDIRFYDTALSQAEIESGSYLSSGDEFNFNELFIPKNKR